MRHLLIILSYLLLFTVPMFEASAAPSKGTAFVPKNMDGDTPTTHHEGGLSSIHSLSADLNSIVDKDLMNDIEMLSSMLASIVRKENPRVYDLYTQMRQHGIDRADDPNNTESFKAMKKLSFDISPVDALGVMRVFSIALNLVNAAEVHHRLRDMRRTEMEASKNSLNVGPLPMVEDSVRGTIDILLEEGNSAEEIFEKLLSQEVEIVITAHPTEGK